jgi:hypothetical protein
VFEKFQKQIIAARDHCCVQSIAQHEGIKIVTFKTGASKVREVRCDIATMIANCSCKLFESHGIPCRHIIQVMRMENQQELPTFYIMERWQRRCKRYKKKIITITPLALLKIVRLTFISF